MIERSLHRLFGLDRLDATFRSAEHQLPERSIYSAAKQILRLRGELDPKDLERVPSTGPVIVAANHPTGAADGLILVDALEKVRKDVKVLSHVWFSRWPALAERMFLIDPQVKTRRCDRNARALAAARQWLADGHVLVVFPAGAVARFQWAERRITDSRWQPGLVRLLQATRATVLPVHLGARNGTLYYLLSLVHPRFGVLMLGRELLNMGKRTIRVRVGLPIPYEVLNSRGRADWLVKFLRRMTYRLEEGSRNVPSAGSLVESLRSASAR